MSRKKFIQLEGLTAFAIAPGIDAVSNGERPAGNYVAGPRNKEGVR